MYLPNTPDSRDTRDKTSPLDTFEVLTQFDERLCSPNRLWYKSDLRSGIYISIALII